MSIVKKQFDEIALQSKRMITCNFDGVAEEKIEEGILYHFGFYRTMYINLNISEMSDSDIGVIPLALTPAAFAKVVEWVKAHIGVMDVELKKDSVTHEQIWLQFTDVQKKFFDSIAAVEELEDIMKAANFLQYDHLYKHCCQQYATLIKNAGSVKNIRKVFGYKDDLTPEEKEEIRNYNVWCKYDE